MPEIVSCPQCQRQLRIPDELLGSQVKCPSCGTTFTGKAATAPPLPTGAFAEEAKKSPPLPEAAAPNLEFDDYHGSQPPFIRRDAAPHRGVLILVFGIIGLVSFFLCGPLAGVFGLVAWILGHIDLKEIRAGQMDREGEGMTQAGRICGIVSVCVSVGICALYGAFLAIMFAGGGFK